MVSYVNPDPSQEHSSAVGEVGAHPGPQVGLGGQEPSSQKVCKRVFVQGTGELLS